MCEINNITGFEDDVVVLNADNFALLTTIENLHLKHLIEAVHVRAGHIFTLGACDLEHHRFHGCYLIRDQLLGICGIKYKKTSRHENNEEKNLFVSVCHVISIPE
jgi:hypothetical protein